MLVLLTYMGARLSRLNTCLADKINVCSNKKIDAVMDKLMIAILGVVFMLIVPTSVFYAIENWKYIDALYFVVMTLSTVGFGDLVPSE